MENMQVILEIKDRGASSATKDDIPLALDTVVKFVNSNHEVQEMVKGLELSGNMNIDGADEVYHMTIKNGVCEYGTGPIDSATFTMNADLLTMSRILLGELDAMTAYFSEAVKVEGDMKYLLLFVEILERALVLLQVVKAGERKGLLEPAMMRELLEIYTGGAENIEAKHVPLFLDVLCAFVNNNPEAQEEIEDSDMIIKMTIEDIGDYYIQIDDGKMTNSKESPGEPSISIAMDVATIGELIADGDAVSAYMAGTIKIDGDISNGMAFQSIMELLIDFLEID